MNLNAMSKKKETMITFVDLSSVMLTNVPRTSLNAGPHSGVYTSDLPYHKSVALVPCHTTQNLVYAFVNYNLLPMIFCLVCARSLSQSIADYLTLLFHNSFDLSTDL